MSDHSHTEPLALLKFVSMEHENFLVSLVNDRASFDLISHLQGLYAAVMSDVETSDSKAVIFQLLTFTHYHFLFSFACLMRCHLSEAFASARAAIDGALVAAQIIHDRPSQVAYLNREKPFNNFARYLGNLIKDGKPLPHQLAPTLFDTHKKLSSFSAHADIDSFMHRVTFTGSGNTKTLSVQYFQFSRNDDERALHALDLLHIFVVVLDVFSDFLVTEQRAMPLKWQTELRGLGAKIERRLSGVKARLVAQGKHAR